MNMSNPIDSGRNAWVLDPFAGSSTTGIAANLIGRRFPGIKKEQDFADMSRKRREEIEDIRIYGDYRSKIKDIAKSEVIQPSCFACEEEPFDDLPF